MRSGDRRIAFLVTSGPSVGTNRGAVCISRSGGGLRSRRVGRWGWDRSSRRCLVRVLNATHSSPDVEEKVEGKKEVKVVLPTVVPVTVVSGNDTSQKRAFVRALLDGIPNNRVRVISTAGSPEPQYVAENGIVHDETETDGAAEAGDPNENLDNKASAPVSITESVEQNNQIDTSENDQNEWIQCATLAETKEVLEGISQDREACEYIILETGNEVVDLKEVASTITRIQTAKVDTMVTVVNSETFLDDLYVNGDSNEVKNTAVGQDPRRATNLVHFVENANVIVLRSPSAEENEESMSVVKELVRSLNTVATIIGTDADPIPIEAVVDTNVFDMESFDTAPSWKRVLIADREITLSDGSPKPLPKSVKDSTFLYRGRRPFHPQRLYNNIKDMSTFSGVIKSIGKLWLATRMAYPLAWNQTGSTITLKQGDRFWASIPDEKWPPEIREQLSSRWDERFGDRETEIIFVGRNMDKAKLQGLLDSCLLQDEEMVFNQAWESMEDPFIEFVPAETEEMESPEKNEEVESPEKTEEVESPEKTEEVESPEKTEETESPEKTEETESPEQTEEMDTPEKTDEMESPEKSEEVDTPEKTEAMDSPEKTEEMDTPERTEEIASQEQTLETLEDAGENTDESARISASATEEGEADATSSTDEPEEKGKESIQQPEGKVNDLDSLPKELLERITELDLRSDGASLKLNPPKSAFDDSDVIVASGDSRVADGILKQIPSRGLAITVVTGFLGAGKTSLINYILTQDHGLRIAVLVNEFGEIDIDNQLVETDWQDDDTILLNNGCICCSINDSFLDAVERILQKADMINYLIVETTGIADPVPIVNSLMITELEQLVFVDSIVTLVDAEHFDPETHMNSEAALSQIAVADTILLSKTDIASKEQTATVIDYVSSIRPGARILKSQHGAVPLELILDVTKTKSTEDVEGTQAETSKNVEGLDDRDHSDCDHEHGNCNHDHDHKHQKSDHLEADGFMSTSFQTSEPFEITQFYSEFLERLPKGVFRAKGLLYFSGYPKRYIFQLSGRRYQFEEDEWPEDVAPNNQVVVIGKDLNIEELKGMLKSCRATAE